MLWRVAVLALAGAFVFTLFGSTAAYAIPGQDATWSHLNVGFGGTQAPGPISTPDTVHETYSNDGRTKVTVWRGFDNQVWVSINSGPAFNIGTTQTYVAPSVAPWGINGAVIFHTGTDHHMYYSFSSAPAFGVGWHAWQALANGTQTTAQTPSPTEIGTSGTQIFVAYRGNQTASSDDQHIYTTYTSDITNPDAWQGAYQVPNILSPSAPSVVWDSWGGQLWMAHRGIDDHVYVSDSPVGRNAWNSSWRSLTETTSATPAIGTDESGHIGTAFNRGLMGILPDDNWPEATVFYDILTIPTGPVYPPSVSEDLAVNSQYWKTNGVAVSTDLETPGKFVAIMTGEDNTAYTQVEADYS